MLQPHFLEQPDVLPEGAKKLYPFFLDSRLKIIYALKVEYRQLNILRVRFLRSLEETRGRIPLADFLGVLRLIVPNSTPAFESAFIEQIQEDARTINYYKLCDLINTFQYQLVMFK